jgi:hypothetical protein
MKQFAYVIIKGHFQMAHQFQDTLEHFIGPLYHALTLK